MAQTEIRVIVTAELDAIATALDNLLKAASGAIGFMDTSRPGGQAARDALAVATRRLDEVAAGSLRLDGAVDEGQVTV